MSYRVKILPEAMEQTRELAQWLSENRPDSRVNIKRAVKQIGDSLQSMPRRFPYDEQRDVRRANLKGTPYYLLFEIDEERRFVQILSVWSGERGEGPDFS